jgi:chemotaxis-related protein WspB
VVVPVVDLCQIARGRSCEPRLSSRIVLVKYQADPSIEPRTLGLLAERVTEIVQIPEDRIQTMGVGTEEAPHLGKVAMDREDMVQFVRVDALLPAEIRERLFTEALS